MSDRYLRDVLHCLYNAITQAVRKDHLNCPESCVYDCSLCSQLEMALARAEASLISGGV